jgi:hypothetical protein
MNDSAIVYQIFLVTNTHCRDPRVHNHAHSHAGFQIIKLFNTSQKNVEKAEAK